MLFSSFLPGLSTADSVKIWQGTEGMFSNVWFKGRLYFSEHLAVFVFLCSSLAQDILLSLERHKEKYNFP